MRRRWLVAWVTGALAALSFVLALIPRAPRPPPSSAPAFLSDDPIPVPQGWGAYPIVGRPDPSPSERRLIREWVFSSVYESILSLGNDVHVQYRWDACTAGGSSCSQAPSTLHHVRVGQLGANGNVEIATDFECDGTAPFLSQMPGARSCSASSFLLRRNGSTFVVTVRDPDTEEKAIAAFTRATVNRPTVRMPAVGVRIDRVLLGAIDAAFLAVGVATLLFAFARKKPESRVVWAALFAFGTSVLASVTWLAAYR